MSRKVTATTMCELITVFLSKEDVYLLNEGLFYFKKALSNRINFMFTFSKTQKMERARLKDCYEKVRELEKRFIALHTHAFKNKEVAHERCM